MAVMPRFNEFQPNPSGSDPSTQTVELIGAPGEAFSGFIVSIESDPGGANPGAVNDFASVSGVFGANGLLTVSIDDLENPSFTLALLDEFTGDGSTDVDEDDDGVADDLSTFGTVFDAIGVPDDAGDEGFLFGAQLGGLDFAFTGDEPRLIFRDSNSGALFAVNDPDDGEVVAVDGTVVAPSAFDADPTAGTDTFGAPNPALLDGGGADPAVAINEIRIDQPGADNDEYFELTGEAGASLDGLTYLVIGDGSGGSGVIETVVALDGLSIPDDGFFLAAEDDDTFGAAADLVTSLNFENSDNVTHLLVRDFTGADGDDLDTDDDGVLDATPWSAVVDGVALVEDLAEGERVYSETQVGPDGSFVPGHVFRLPDGSGAFQIGGFTAPTDDTPGESNEPSDNQPAEAAIFEIQGAGHTSPLLGERVVTTGVVTATDSNGFYLQDPEGDDDIATSDAIFVFTGSAPGVTVGDAVTVEGTVSEFFPGGEGTGNLSTTQLSGSPVVTVESSGEALPEAVILGAGGRTPPTEIIDDDAFASFDPETDGIDFFESLEAMLVTGQDLVAVAGTNRFGEIFAVVDNGEGATGLSERGTLNISPDDFNPERIQIDEDTGILPGFSLPEVAVGARLGNVTGVVSYDFGNFQIHPTETFAVIEPSSLEPEVTSITTGGDTLTIASYNVLNLDPNPDDGDDDEGVTRFDEIARQIVEALGEPDIIGLQEIQDNSGSLDDGQVGANETLQRLVDALAVYTATYEFIDNTFIENNSSGGQPGGNIRTAFLYNPDRVSVVDGSIQTIGSQEPGGAFDGARLPLVATFAFNGEEVTVVNNHFSSKGGSAPILGVEQPFEERQEDVTVNGSLDERQAQSAAVRGFVTDLLADDPLAKIAVVGDFNEFEFVSPVSAFGETPLSFENLTEELPEDERYSFIFQGNSQSLDHIIVSPELYARFDGYDVVNVNVEFAETPGRASDHDPVLAAFTIPEQEPERFTLEILHMSDQEAGEDAVEDAPRAARVMEALERQDLGNDGVEDNTVRLSSGDAIIPGLFFTASEAVYGAAGRADIRIQNLLEFDAISFGNHEFDLGTAFLADLIAADPSEDWEGAQFPYLAANLDFSTDANLAGLAVPDDQAPLPNSVTGTTVLDVNGEQVGVVGAVTPNLGSISSPGGVGIQPFAFGSSFTDEEAAALADEINAEVAEMIAANPGLNKVVLLAHFQRFGNEEKVAALLENVDIVMAGGSNTLLADETDVLRSDDDADGPYPTFTTGADGNPIAIISTDGNYRYVGRLVIDFDENGVIDPDSYDAEVSGAYATDDAGVEALEAEGLIDPEIEEIDEIAAAIGEQIEALKQTTLGFTDVYLDGRRGSVRTEETNLGNLTADANLAEARKTDTSVLVSIKNGGGIRDDIGDVDADTGAESPPEGGGITIADALNVLRFNNDLTLLTLSGAELAAVLEHGVSATEFGETPGRFPQVSGVEFSFDPTRAPGSRILDATVLDENGDPLIEVVRDGEVVAPEASIRIVTLGFLAGGGDDYPFPTGPEANRVDLISDQGLRTGAATFAVDGTEQDAFAEYLIAAFGTPEDAFDLVETVPTEDQRIRPTVQGTGDSDNLVGTGFAETLVSGAGAYDRISGGDGLDRFLFTADELTNGARERNAVLDYEKGEVIAIELAEDQIVARFSRGQVLIQAGDDRIYVTGDGIASLDDVTILSLVEEPAVI